MNAKQEGNNDPQIWLDRAKSNLSLAKTQKEDVLLEDLCFEAQQATEKATKALLIYLGGDPLSLYQLLAKIPAREVSNRKKPFANHDKRFKNPKDGLRGLLQRKMPGSGNTRSLPKLAGHNENRN